MSTGIRQSCCWKEVVQVVSLVLLLSLLPAAAKGECSLSVVPLNFGSIQTPVPAPTVVETTAGLGITCAATVAYLVSIDGGNGHQGAFRHMSHAGSQLPYQLFKDSSFVNAWGDGYNGLGEPLSGIGSGNQNGHTIYAKMLIDQQAVAGLYSDSVLITVSW